MLFNIRREKFIQKIFQLVYCNKMTRIGNERKIANVVNRGAERSLLNEKRVRKRRSSEGVGRDSEE